MNIGKKILTLGFSVAVLLSSTSAFAGTIGATKLSGTNAATGNVVLGSATHHLKVDSSSGKGTGTGSAYAKKIVPYFFDQTVATVKITAPNTGSTSFTAESTNSSGTPQSYYIQWNGGNSTAATTASITH